MAVTSPDNLWSPDGTDDYNLTTDLAAMQDTVQDALTGIHSSLDPLAADTGWVDIVIASGFSATSSTERPAVRRIGSVVHVRGGWSGTGIGASNSYVIGTVPSGFRPSVNRVGTYGGATGPQVGVIRFDFTGDVQVRTGATAPTYVFPAISSWTVD